MEQFQIEEFRVQTSELIIVEGFVAKLILNIEY